MTAPCIDVAVIGAMKCASTTVTDYLRQHPDVFVPERKLLNHFSYGLAGATLSEQAGSEATASAQAVRDPAEYAPHFAGVTAGQLRADCSDSYYFFDGTADRLHAHNPELKIIVTLRDPVARAFSSFNHARSHLLESAPDFEAAFARSAKDEAQLLPIRRYRSLGCYGALLRPYVAAFGTERIHLVSFDALASNYDGTLHALTDFLGTAPFAGSRLWSNPTFVPPDGLSGRMIHAAKGPARRLLRAVSGTNEPKALVKSLMQRIYRRPAPLDPEIAQRLRPAFDADLAQLEALFGPGFYSRWRV